MAKLSPFYTWRSAVTESDLTAGAKHVALTLSLYMSEKQTSAWPSQKTLAHDTGRGERSIRRHLDELEERGFIRREKRMEKGHKRQTDLIHTVVPGDAANMTGYMRPPVPGDAATVAGELSNEVGRVSQETLPAKNPRKRDPLWDVFTEELYPAVTANERGRRNAALKQIREALEVSGETIQTPHGAGFGLHNTIAVKYATEEEKAGELRARIARYRVRFPGVACTETAIASHWSSLAGPNGRPAQPPCPECEMGGGQHAADCSQISVGSVT